MYLRHASSARRIDLWRDAFADAHEPRPAGVGLGVGHVDAVLAHAARELELGLLGPRSRIRGRRGVRAAAGSEREAQPHMRRAPRRDGRVWSWRPSQPAPTEKLLKRQLGIAYEDGHAQPQARSAAAGRLGGRRCPRAPRPPGGRSPARGRSPASRAPRRPVEAVEDVRQVLRRRCPARGRARAPRRPRTAPRRGRRAGSTWPRCRAGSPTARSSRLARAARRARLAARSRSRAPGACRARALDRGRARARRGAASSTARPSAPRRARGRRGRRRARSAPRAARRVARAARSALGGGQVAPRARAPRGSCAAPSAACAARATRRRRAGAARARESSSALEHRVEARAPGAPSSSSPRAVDAAREVARARDVLGRLGQLARPARRAAARDEQARARRRARRRRRSRRAGSAQPVERAVDLGRAAARPAARRRRAAAP